MVMKQSGFSVSSRLARKEEWKMKIFGAIGGDCEALVRKCVKVVKGGRGVRKKRRKGSVLRKVC